MRIPVLILAVALSVGPCVGAVAASSDAEMSALAYRVETLAAVNERLAQRVQQLEAQLRGKLKVNDLEIAGRLDVRNGGVPIFSVSSTGSETTVTIHNVSGPAEVELASRGSVGYVAIDTGGGKYVQMGGSPEEVGLIVHSDEFESEIISGSSFDGFRMKGNAAADTDPASAPSSGTVVTALGRRLEEMTTLHINDDTGGEVVMAGANKEHDGAGLFVVRGSGGKDSAVIIGANSDGQGSVYIYDGGIPIAAMDGQKHSIDLIGPDGKMVIAALREANSKKGGAVSAFTNEGLFAFSGGASDEQGDACVFRGSKGTWCLGVGLPLK